MSILEKINTYLVEKLDTDWIGDNILDKKYKGMVVVNAVYADKEGTTIKFWVRDPKTKKITEVRPMPKKELLKVLK